MNGRFGVGGTSTIITSRSKGIASHPYQGVDYFVYIWFGLGGLTMSPLHVFHTQGMHCIVSKSYVSMYVHEYP